MRVVIRVDASVAIGSGHVMRCLTLAVELRSNGSEVIFICRDLPGNLIDFVVSKGFPVYRLPAPRCDGELQPEKHYASRLGDTWRSDADETRSILTEIPRQDWLVADSYAIDSRWEKLLRSDVDRIMVIDDLADRRHDCDLLLDQNLYEDMQSRYDGLVPEGCRKLLGPDYVLLRPEFFEARKRLRRRDGVVRRILVFFGGTDPTGETIKALKAIKSLNLLDIAVDVVVGTANPRREEIKELCRTIPGTCYYVQVENMADLMIQADLAIGAGGTTTWERCFLGLPTITIIAAQNQAQTTLAVAKKEAIRCLGHSANVSAGKLANAIENALANPCELKEMGEKASNLMGAFTEVSRHILFYSQKMG